MTAIAIDSAVKTTPEGKPFTAPTQALADAIAAEWNGQKKFRSASMPLTALAYTAIDRIAGHEAEIIEALMVYIDTDTLAYRSQGSEKLSRLQQQKWDPVLAWARKLLGVTWETTAGLMPIEQLPQLHAAVEKKLQSLTAPQLAAFCLLASGFSSLVLALAVLEKHLDAAEAFALSRLEEEAQAEAWGRDAEAEQRAARMQAEIVEAAQFLRLLNAA